MSEGMRIRLLPNTVGLVTVSRAGPDLWEITMNLDGVLWTAYAVGPEDRDQVMQQVQRLVEGTP